MKRSLLPIRPQANTTLDEHHRVVQDQNRVVRILENRIAELEARIESLTKATKGK